MILKTTINRDIINLWDWIHETDFNRERNNLIIKSDDLINLWRWIFSNDNDMFKCLVNKHVNDCRECLDVIYRFDEDEKCFRFAVDLDDEFIIRSFLLWDIIDDQLFEVLSDEFVYFIVFVIDNKLLKTTLKFWTCFVCRITIDKTFLRFFAFFFDMIR